MISFLIVSGSSLSLLFFWDLLGVSSFILVLYYFTQASVVGSLATSLSGRVGDYFLVLSLLCSLCSTLPVVGWYTTLVFLVFVVVAFTKSAMYPFMGWLPRAMAAPTPVSSLVHSSTLVVAGLFLLLYYSWLLPSVCFSLVVVFTSLLSMFLSGVLALLEEDLKKLVAFSTLSQIAMCMLALGLSLPLCSVVQAFSHALYKSALFMGVGYFIYGSLGQQNSRSFTGGPFVFPYLTCLWSFSGLCGLLTTSGGLSKEFFVSGLLSVGASFIFLLGFLVAVCITLSYCFRLWFSLTAVGGGALFISSSTKLFFSCVLPLFLSGVMCNFALANYVGVPLLLLSTESLLPCILFWIGGLLVCRFAAYFRSRGSCALGLLVLGPPFMGVVGFVGCMASSWCSVELPV